ncbi:hypothetical protein PRIPAC_71054 [Pristionchus pacificus]|uniref:RBR-type E3 ubiquitin transferase n=1 Tax=Pristionchus pacificus TaxID=54126 RepID=A0A2A6B4C7_PRIPA|nr:hypothetical protein PRIPAC_71054 [Pristionchus pacificus]|eukprot:PDM60730.1 hypothetical protein PRIPAC_54536 [Pristionchus pacificus]
MRVDRNRRYRARPIHVGPSTVIKEIVPEDSAGLFFNTWNDVTHNNATMTAPDPLGLDGFNVPYSLNKKERWTIPDRLKEEIEELQDPRHNLRVSAATHEFDRADRTMEKAMGKEIRNKPARSYHTVSRDGKKIINNYAKKGQARMQTLINPKGLKPWDFRKDQWKRKKQKENWAENMEVQAYLPEEDVEDQKLHVMYSAVEMVAKPTTFNRLPREKKAVKKRGTVARNHHEVMLEPLYESDLEEDEDEDEQETDSPHAPPVAPSLASFLVPQPSKHAHPRHPRSKRESFKDESFRSSSLSLISGGEILAESSTEDEDEAPPEDVVIVESPSRIVLVTALPQLYTKIRLSETQLESLPALPVQPRAWQVHSDATLRVLGRAYPICILTKELGEGEVGLFAQEDCLSCADRWGRYAVLLEEKGEIKDQRSVEIKDQRSTACIVCCREMAADTVFEQSRPFSLSCGHACCTGCWLQTISDGMKKGRVPTECPEPSCSLTLSITAASALLDSASLRRYTEAMTEVLLRSQTIVRCRDCSRLHRVVSSKPSVRCVCGTSICARCSSVAHAPVSCKAFRDYCSYMQKNGLSTNHVSFADAPIIRNLAQCPKCGLLSEAEYEWCYNLDCLCGERFCYKCSKKWTDAHWQCEAEGMMKSVTMIDVSSSRGSDLHSTMLTLSIGARLSYFERRKEVMDRLQSLSIKSRKEFDKTFSRLSHLMEICYLNSTKSKRSLVLAERIQFAMSYFFNTEDKNRRNLLRKTELLRKILNDISTELFGGVSGVHKKK